MNKSVRLWCLALVILGLGFLRDFFFENINWIYLNKTIDRPNQAVHSFDFLIAWDISEIVILKYVLTAVFFCLFCGLTLLFFHLKYRSRVYNRVVGIAFLGMMTLSVPLYGLALATSYYWEFYAMVIALTHTAQSFVPLLVFLVIFTFFPKTPVE